MSQGGREVQSGSRSGAPRIAVLDDARRIWAVAAIHGEARRLEALHRAMAERMEQGDRIVYLGNMIGHGPQVRETLDHLLAFRCAVMALPGGRSCHLIYLRGSQEVMWHKMLQLQFTPAPADNLAWMLDRGLAATLSAYGGDGQEGLRAARGGTMALTRWTGSLRQAMQRHPGHGELLGRLTNAARSLPPPTETVTGGLDETPPGAPAPGGLLFVNAGLDPARSLDRQSDFFWWHGAGFSALNASYQGFTRVIRGFNSRHGAPEEAPHKVSLDAGSGFGGPLQAACFLPSGEIVERLEA